jgi:protoporphyrinogen oxidase
MKKSLGILGGGIAGTVLAHAVSKDVDITILEAESQGGGLARSWDFHGFPCDVGPHIIFSKSKKAFDFLLEMGGDDLGCFERHNQIWYKGALIKYPFENYLYLLPPDERNECLKAFIDNPYQNYAADNMLHFFLKNFGAGITNTYLRPYNEKIWKFDPAFMDTQMVSRIPKPPAEDIISGAKGKPKEGYTHQAKFFYPKSGGIQTLFDNIVRKLSANARYLTSHQVASVEGSDGAWKVSCSNGAAFKFDRIVNCMPLHNLFPILKFEVPQAVGNALSNLRYNSLYFGIVLYSKDNAGDNFSFNIPESHIIFHRVSKLNLITPQAPSGKSAFLYEITYREKTGLAEISEEELKNSIIDGFEKIDLARKEDFLDFTLRKAKYAYVIYDLDHRKNTDAILKFLKSKNISSCGRFAQFEYLNIDHVVDHAFALGGEINGINSSLL